MQAHQHEHAVGCGATGRGKFGAQAKMIHDPTPHTLLGRTALTSPALRLSHVSRSFTATDWRVGWPVMAWYTQPPPPPERSHAP